MEHHNVKDECAALTHTAMLALESNDKMENDMTDITHEFRPTQTIRRFSFLLDSHPVGIRCKRYALHTLSLETFHITQYSNELIYILRKISAPLVSS